MKRIRLPHVVFWSLVLAAVIGAIFFGPLLLTVLRAQAYEHRAGSPELQRIVERADWSGNRVLSASIAPYDSISLETDPCFGPCPIYVLTIHRDGRARLVTDHLSRVQRRTYQATISHMDYARLTQLVTLARAAARENRYAGEWTDDSEAIVRATSRGTTWQVSDYGGVSPPEVWALIEILRSYRKNIDWEEAPAGR